MHRLSSLLVDWNGNSNDMMTIGLLLGQHLHKGVKSLNVFAMQHTQHQLFPPQSALTLSGSRGKHLVSHAGTTRTRGTTAQHQVLQQLRRLTTGTDANNQTEATTSSTLFVEDAKSMLPKVFNIDDGSPVAAQ